MSEEKVWHLYTSEGSQGPYTAAELRAWRSSGKINDEWNVWREGYADWKRVGDTPELLVNSAPTARSPSAPAPSPVLAVDVPAAAALADPIFGRDKFLLNQKHLSISEKYYVWDDQGNQILFVERPSHIFRNLLALIAGVAAGFVFAGVMIAVTTLLPGELLKIIFALLTVIGFFLAIGAVATALSVKRHVSFYKDDTKRERVLEVLQDSKIQFITATYSVMEPNGQLLAKFRKNYIVAFIRKSWECLRPDGTPICVAMEDSIILSLLRRLLGPFFGLLRTNFIICRGKTDEIIGEFNRKFTLMDKYVLDMTADPDRTVDRRVALALGVMLDTGERR